MTLCLDMTPDGAGHSLQMTDNAEIEVPHDWHGQSACHSTRTSAARMPRDTVTGSGSKCKIGIRPGSKEQGRWAVRSPANTRAIGNIVMVELRKGPRGGLGFSITTRDNLEGPNSPIYIKHVLPDGAAIKDGRLRPGDRLLQVNDVLMTGKCLNDVTAILRNIEIDALTRIVISRQMAAQNETKASPQNEPKASSQNETKASSQNETKASSQNETKASPQNEAKASSQNETKASPQNEAKASSQNETKASPQNEAKASSQNETKASPQNEAKASSQNEAKASPQIVIDGGDCSEESGSKEDALVSICSASESNSSTSLPQVNCDYKTETLWLRVAHDGSARSDQLGLKVKRSRKQNFSGLHVRSVITGGLADKDGQLQANDHLIQVNGISLADIDRSTVVNIFRSALQRSVENLSAIEITIVRWKVPETFPPSKLEPMICDENIERLTLNTILEKADCDKRIILFSNITGGADVVEGFPVDSLALVDHDVVFSSGKHSCDFLPDGNVLPQVEGQTPAFREIEVCITCRFSDDNSASAASSLESSDAIVQEKEEVDLKVACFERQGFGRKSISEKRSSRELLSDSEVYRSIKENRKRKDQMKPEIIAGFHEASDFDRGELEFREQFHVLEPATLESNPQVSIPHGSDPQGPLLGSSTTLVSISDNSNALGLLPGESNQQGSLPNQSTAHPVPCNPLESVWLGNAPTRSIPHGSASHNSDPQGSTQNESSSVESISQISHGFVPCGPVPLGPILHRSVPLRSLPPGSVLKRSIRHESVQLGSDPNGPVPLGSFPVGSVPCESLPQKSVPSVPRGSLSHKSVPRESVPHGFIPSGSIPQESIPLGSTPDVLMNACKSNDLHVKRSTDVSTTDAMIGLNDSVVHSNSSSSSSTSSQIPSETFSTASSSSTKPSKKFTASLIRRFFKKGFAEIFGSETQTRNLRQSDEEKNEGIVKHLTPIRKDFSLPRQQSGRTDSDVISSSHSHPDLQYNYPNALRIVPPNIYNPELFLRQPTGFRVPQPSARNCFPVQFYRPNPYPFSTVLVRPPVPAIPTGFALYPTYVPLQRAAIQACPIQGNRFPGPPFCPARLSWVGLRQKFVNVQQIASKEPR